MDQFDPLLPFPLGARYGRNAHMSGPSVETGRPGLAFVLVCEQPEGSNERDPKARGDPGCGGRRIQPFRVPTRLTGSRVFTTEQDIHICNCSTNCALF